MQTPEEVAAIVRLKALGWGIKRIARELGCRHMTVRHYVAQGGWVPYRGAVRPPRWPGLKTGWPNVFAAMPGIPMWCAKSWWPRRASD
jgi:hypothetical protein